MERPKYATHGPVPQHLDFYFEEEGIRFSSDFDSGNLMKVEKTNNSSYELWIGPDCADTLSVTACRTWFYFQVKLSANSSLTFTIKNLNLQAKLFREGMKPVMKTPSSDWHRVSAPVTSNVSGDVGSLFELTFSSDFPENEAFFAFTYPWSYAQSLQLTEEIQQISLDSEIYFHKENLVYSLEKRKCEILTISSYKNILSDNEENVGGLFPERERSPNKFSEKPIVFISARVHPGETPGSHALNGFLKFISSPDPRAVVLRDEFVFKVVPIINPDGVFRGHYRTDTQGLNLNRFYSFPTLHQHPTVYAIKKVFMHYNDTYKPGIYCYIDLHAHASKQACFIYGNYMNFLQQLEACTFAKLLSLNCANFDFEGSSFAESNMVAKDKRDGLSKEGSGRVALYRSSNITRCYTLECNYNSGHILNKLEHSGLPEAPEGDTSSCIYANGIPPYTEKIFENIGGAISVALLDNILKNPYSRVLMTDPQLKIVKYQVGTQIARFIPFRFDGTLKRAVKSIGSFEIYLTCLVNRKENAREESKIIRKKPPLKPLKAAIKSRSEKHRLPLPKHNTTPNSRDSKKSLHNDVAIIPLKNFIFSKSDTSDDPQRGRNLAKTHKKQGSMDQRTVNPVKNSSIPLRTPNI